MVEFIFRNKYNVVCDYTKIILHGLPMYRCCSIINLLYYIRIVCITAVVVYIIDEEFLRGGNLVAVAPSDFLRIFVHVCHVFLKTTPVTAIGHFVISDYCYCL